MKNPFFLLSVILFAGLQAQALHLQYVGETSIATGTKFNKTTIGGISGIVWSENLLYALSDDKGKMGEPRFYGFDLKIDKSKVTLNAKTVSFITGLPMIDGKKPGLDPEGIVRLPNGDFLISSEGNNNAKPREMPRILRTDSHGKWKSDLPIPDKYLPELTGQQKKGIQNNTAFEGLTTFAEGKFVFTNVEASLLQDTVSGDNVSGDWIRILKFEDKGTEGYKPIKEFAYQIDALKDNGVGSEVFRGVSEILALSETKLIVLERGVRLSRKNIWTNTVTLYLADVSKATDVLPLHKLSDGKYTGAEKIKLIDFETDLTKERAGKTVQNFEALSWGPKLTDGRRSLLVMVDNNFSKKEITELLVFAVDGE